jgi:hypothetical protein
MHGKEWHNAVYYGMASFFVKLSEFIPRCLDIMANPFKTHNTTETRQLLAEIGTPQNEGFMDYDLITQIRVPDVQNLVDLKNDPFFKEKVLADNGRFTDPTRVLYAHAS